ncbi:MAG: TM0996/MTH895 family glutaredoxin-like protein [Dehalococcoidia bacterium]|nr:MAG: TM0996/MTH895 family glutaredoxin-like protein [Dehalococcoidia bacterium]
MKIKILGPGCAKCHSLDKLVREVVKELNVDAQVEYIQDMAKILEYPILITPGLIINEEVKCSGSVPSKNEITKLITNALVEEIRI